MKRKLISTVLMSFMFLLSFNAIALAQNSTTMGMEEAQKFSGTVAFIEVKDGPYEASVLSEKEVDEKLNEIANMTQEEFTNVILNLINENINKDNVLWTDQFINDYVAIYCPEYVSQLQAKDNTLLLSGIPSIQPFAYAGSNSIEHTVLGEGGLGLDLYELELTVDWNWDTNGKVTECVPQTVPRPLAGGCEFAGFNISSQKPVNSGASYEVDKEAHFKYSVGDYNWHHYYPRIKVQVHAGGDWDILISQD